MLCVSNLILIFWGLIYAVRPVMQPRDQLLAQCMFINVVIILTVFKYALSFWCSSAVVIYVLKRSSLDLTDGVRHVKSVLRGSQISLTMRMTVDEVKEKKKTHPVVGIEPGPSRYGAGVYPIPPIRNGRKSFDLSKVHGRAKLHGKLRTHPYNDDDVQLEALLNQIATGQSQGHTIKRPNCM